LGAERDRSSAPIHTVALLRELPYAALVCLLSIVVSHLLLQCVITT
jgi:hypothetical protein